MHKMSNNWINTAGAIAFCAVNTDNGSTTVTFNGNARKCKGSGTSDFNGGQCNSAARDCRVESGDTPWGKAMIMAQHVYNYAQSGYRKAPPGTQVVYYRY